MGHTQAWAGGLWATAGGLSIFCGVIWGSISDRIGRGKGAALAYLVLGVSCIVYALVKVEAGFYVSAILFGLTAWSIPTIMAAAAGDFVGPRLAPAGASVHHAFLWYRPVHRSGAWRIPGRCRATLSPFPFWWQGRYRFAAWCFHYI